MGAAPRLALLSLVLPPALLRDDFDALVSGLAALALRHKLHRRRREPHALARPLMIDVTVTGTAKRRQVLTRGGARPGDELYVTGSLGGAAAGLDMLRHTTRAVSEAEDLMEGDTEAQAMASCAHRYLYPEPRVRTGLALGRNRVASACMDLSDGLADGVRQIAEASGVGVIVDADAIPVDEQARAWFNARGGDALTQALSAGDDYELLFTVPRRANRSAPRCQTGYRRGGHPHRHLHESARPDSAPFKRDVPERRRYPKRLQSLPVTIADF